MGKFRLINYNSLFLSTMCVPNYSYYAHISPHNLTLESDYSFSRF